MKTSLPPGPCNFMSYFVFGSGSCGMAPSLSARQSAPVKTPRTPGIAWRGGLVDPQDARMRMRRADDRRVSLTRKAEVVAELPAAREQSRIFVARHRLADKAKLWRIVGHRRMNSDGNRRPDLSVTPVYFFFAASIAWSDARPTLRLGLDEAAEIVRAAAEGVQPLHVHLFQQVRILECFVRRLGNRYRRSAAACRRARGCQTTSRC